MKQVGGYMLNNVSEAFRGVGWKVFKQLGLSPDEIDELATDAKRGAADPRYRWFGTL